MKIAAPDQKGFSLIELMVVIVLIAIISSIASMSWDFIKRERLASAAKELAADIQKVRVDAMVNGPTASLPALRGFGVRFDSAGSYTTFTFNDANGNFFYSGSAEAAGSKVRPIHPSLTLEVAETPAYNVVIYDRMGLPKKYQAGGGSPSDDAVFEMIILVKEASLNRTKCVAISMNRIREGNWNAGTCTEH